jgi:MFS superfamily sulfate permease-like transporter
MPDKDLVIEPEPKPVKKDDYTAPGNDVVHFLLEVIALFFLVYVGRYGPFVFSLVAFVLTWVVVAIMCYDVYRYAIVPSIEEGKKKGK